MFFLAHLYLAATPGALRWLAETKRPYYHLRPPAVDGELLWLPDVELSNLGPDFEVWKRTATMIEPDSIRSRLPVGTPLDVDLDIDWDVVLAGKWIAQKTGAGVGWYTIETPGSTEFEWAWQFGPIERVLIHTERCVLAETSTIKPWFFPAQTSTKYRTIATVFELTARETIAHEDVGECMVLALLLRSLGLPNATGQFVPHHREFDPSPYRVG